MLTLTPSGTYSRPTMPQRMSPPDSAGGSGGFQGSLRRPEIPRLQDVLWTPAPSRVGSPEYRPLKRSRSPSFHSSSRGGSRGGGEDWSNELSWNRPVGHLPEHPKRYTPLTPDSPSMHHQPPSMVYGEYPAKLRLHSNREREPATALDADSSDVEDAQEFPSAIRFPMSVVRGGS